MSTNLFKILLLIFVAFAVGEIIFTIQRYGFPKIDLFKPRSGSCKILEEKYCSEGKYSSLKETQFVGFKLPPGTTIFSPIDGRQTIVKINQPNPVQGSQLSIFPEDRSLSYILVGDIQGEDKFAQAGKASGLIGNSGIKNFEGYNLIITINRFNPVTKTSLLDIELLRKLFPNK